MKKNLQIRSIEYVYDPDATGNWFDLWVNAVKKRLLEELGKED